MPSLCEEDSINNRLWQEYIINTALMCTIVIEAEYVGYCGIKNVESDKWEIEIELRKAWRHKGIGYTVIGMLLDEIKARLGVTEFRIRIDPDNYASQAMFEKLGAIPNGISEFLLHGEEEIKLCEEKFLHLIDDKIRAVAEKSNVEPRRLLSHILEYKLIWK